MLVRDIGPYRIFSNLRNVDRCSKLLKCPFCTSVWVSACVNTLYYFTVAKTASFVVVLMTIFAMSAITVILDRTWTADYQPK